MLTPQKEKFVHALIEGNNNTAAYRIAFDTSDMEPKSIWNAAHRLRKDREVSARYDELLAEVTNNSIGIREELIEQDKDVAKANILDFVEISEDGFGKSLLKLRDDIPNGKGRAIKSMSVDARGSLRIELYDKTPYIERLRKTYGMDTEQVEQVSVKIEIPGDYGQ